MSGLRSSSWWGSGFASALPVVAANATSKLSSAGRPTGRERSAALRRRALGGRRAQLVPDLLQHEQDRVERAVHVAELRLDGGPGFTRVEALREGGDRALDSLQRVHQLANGVRHEAWHAGKIVARRADMRVTKRTQAVE